MKLLMHNMLQSHVPGVAPGLHFLIEPHQLSTVESDFNAGAIQDRRKDVADRRPLSAMQISLCVT